MDEPSELSLREIHKYFVRNNYKVTNTQLVKYFRKFLTGSRVGELKCIFRRLHIDSTMNETDVDMIK